MVLTVAKLEKFIKHALDGAQGAPISSRELVNQVGEWFCSQQAWRFNKRRTRLNVRQSITLATGVYNAEDLTIKQAGAFDDYTHTPGDIFEVDALATLPNTTGSDSPGAGEHVIKRKLDADVIELEAAIHRNLIEWTEDFDDVVNSAYWTEVNAPLSYVTDTSGTTDPLGGNTADEIQDDNLSAVASISRAFTTTTTPEKLTNGKSYCFSTHVKQVAGNLLKRSADLDPSEWDNVGLTVITLNDVTDPVGGSTGFLLKDNDPDDFGPGQSRKEIKMGVVDGLIDGELHTWSVYIRFVDSLLTGIRVTFADAGTSDFALEFNWATLTCALLGTGEPDNTPTVACTDEGGGWWRLALTMRFRPTGGQPKAKFQLIPDRNNSSELSAHFWGPQLEVGSTLTSYAPNSQLLNLGLTHTGGVKVIDLDFNTLTGVASAPTVAGPALTGSGFETLAGGWYRPWITMKFDSQDSVTLTPSFTPQAGTGEPTGVHYIWGTQVEEVSDSATGPSKYERRDDDTGVWSPATVSGLIPNNVIPLPGNIASVLAVATNTETLDGFRWTDQESMAYDRIGRRLFDNYGLRGALVSYAPSGGGSTQYRLELDPTQNSTDELEVRYISGWNRVETDTEELPLPADGWLDGLFTQAVIAWSQGLDAEDEAPLYARLDALAQSSMWMTHVGRDAGMQSDMGPTRGSDINRRYDGGRSRFHDISTST